MLAFYRGGWCPYCDIMLRALDQRRPAIMAAGASLIGVSPERPEELARTAGRLGLGLGCSPTPTLDWPAPADWSSRCRLT